MSAYNGNLPAKLVLDLTLLDSVGGFILDDGEEVLNAHFRVFLWQKLEVSVFSVSLGRLGDGEEAKVASLWAERNSRWLQEVVMSRAFGGRVPRRAFRDRQVGQLKAVAGVRTIADKIRNSKTGAH